MPNTIKPGDKHKTAFVFDGRIYQFNVVPFTPPIAIPKPSNLPSDICTISSGIGNFDLNKAPHEMRGECGQSSTLNPFGVNYVSHIVNIITGPFFLCQNRGQQIEKKT